MAFISKPVSDNRRRKRCGLDLGGLDAFPLVVERWISRTYSTLELRQRVCLELILTLEHIADISMNAQLAGTFGDDDGEGKGKNKNKPKQSARVEVTTNITIDGGRVRPQRAYIGYID